ncbi:MAG: HIT family protein [Candidatus Microgenomates bacterium]
MRCKICEIISKIKKGLNKNFIKEFNTGYLVLEDYQYFKGYVIFISKIHKQELHQLSYTYKKNFLLEMAYIAEIIYKIFKPKKINYELLGNKYSHLHWHIIPRYKNEKLNNKPIWIIPEDIRKKNYLSNEDRNKIIKKIREAFFSNLQY